MKIKSKQRKMLEFMYIIHVHVIIGVFFSFFYWEGGLIGHVQAEYLLIYLDISDFIKDINTSKADSKH